MLLTRKVGVRRVRPQTGVARENARDGGRWCIARGWRRLSLGTRRRMTRMTSLRTVETTAALLAEAAAGA